MLGLYLGIFWVFVLPVEIDKNWLSICAATWLCHVIWQRQLWTPCPNCIFQFSVSAWWCGLTFWPLNWQCWWPCCAPCSMVTQELWIIECKYQISVSHPSPILTSFLCRYLEQTWSLPWSCLIPTSWTRMSTMCWQTLGGRNGRKEFRCQSVQGPFQSQ